MPWLTFQRGTITPYNIDFLLKTVENFKRHPIGCSGMSCYYVNEGSRLYFGWKKQDAVVFWGKFKKILLSPRRFQKYCSLLDNEFSAAFKSADIFLNKDLSVLNNYSLSLLFSKVQKWSSKINFITINDLDVFDVFFSDWLYSKIMAELNGLEASQADDIYNKLIQPTKPSYVTRQEIMAMRLAKQPNLEKSALKLYKNFWWTSLGWESTEPHSLDYFKTLIEGQSKYRDLDRVIKQKLSFGDKNFKLRQSLIRKFSLSDTAAHLLHVADKYADYHDKRKEIQVKVLYCYYKILKEVAKRFSLEVKDLEWLWHDEVKELLRTGNLDRTKISERQRCVASVVAYHKRVNYNGQEALLIKNKNIKIVNKNKKNLLGLGAFPGLVKGRVKVCAGAKEALEKIKKGDILVCPMTLPEYVPAMRKAKAIVTNEGGITSHAAIISREFKIPCVVGTKTATEILHDGDLIEIDAKLGKIKLLQNNEN